MRRIHQLVVSAAPGDAITNAALDLQVSLGAVAESRVFAAFVDPALGSQVHPLGDFARLAGSADLLVLHHSIGEPQMAGFLAGRAEPLAVIYHNISPAEAFAPWSPYFAELLAYGRRQLGALAGRASLGLAVSAFNAAELERAGFRSVGVSALTVDAAALLDLGPDPVIAARLGALDGPVVLSVGQLLPHKRLDWLLVAYHVLVTHLVPEAWLVVVGADRLPGYGAALRALAARLGLTRALFAGPLSQPALAACWRRASVFATASEHEGFCVPVLEAMAFGVPVLARDYAAVAETLGGGGLLLGAGDSPLVAAEALAALIEDGPLRQSVLEAGRRRLARSPAAQTRQEVLAALLGAAGGNG